LFGNLEELTTGEISLFRLGRRLGGFTGHMLALWASYLILKQKWKQGHLW